MMDKSANCRALQVLCAAANAERLDALKRAAVAAEWELVGGAVSLEELLVDLSERRPNVVVLDASLGQDAAIRAREVLPQARIVSVGRMPGADALASGLPGVRAAIMGVPDGLGRPGRSGS
jgi:hypothetical protein